MKIHLDESQLLRELAPLLETPSCQTGIANLTSDPFFVAFFLVSVSQGEGLGEAAVGMIGQEEVAQRIGNLAAHMREERGHKEQTLDAARELFPQYFEDGEYLHRDRLEGMPYYVAVLEAVRSRLKQTGRYSRLNLYFTTTFGYEVMVLLLYQAVANAVANAPLPDATRDRLVAMITSILAEEETHVGVVGQHNALLAMPRTGLSQDANEMLGALEGLSAEDYRFAAELAVLQVAEMMNKYVDAPAYRAEIERGLASADSQA